MWGYSKAWSQLIVYSALAPCVTWALRHKQSKFWNEILTRLISGTRPHACESTDPFRQTAGRKVTGSLSTFSIMPHLSKSACALVLVETAQAPTEWREIAASTLARDPYLDFIKVHKSKKKKKKTHTHTHRDCLALLLLSPVFKAQWLDTTDTTGLET